MCDFPINIKNPNYGKIPGEMLRVLVPCSKCQKCTQRKSSQWFVRLHHELKTANTAHFVTLTYAHAPRTYNELQTVQKRDLQNYFKRLRKLEPKNKKIKYYAVSEYGEKYHRPHYHIILFNAMRERHIHDAWSLNNTPIGLTHIGEVEEASINYVTGYIGKKIGIPWTDYDDREKEFSLMSKNMGLHFIDKAGKFTSENELGYTIIDGIKYTLPRYYKNKLYDKYKLKKISNANYNYFLKNQDRHAQNFASLNDWEANSREIAQRNNNYKSTIINPNF